MAELPLLVFPTAKVIEPPKGNGFAPSKPHTPGHASQTSRINPQLKRLQDDFSKYKASMGDAVAGLEPETVLVIEIAGTVDDFRQAVEAAGLEWLGEWDVDEIEPDEDFYDVNKKGEKTDKLLSGRLFLSLGNDQGINELISLWGMWEAGKSLPIRKTKWRDVFAQLRNIRRWGIEETLGEARMLERWQDFLASDTSGQPIQCQIELFYRTNQQQRTQNEQTLNNLLARIGGRAISPYIDLPVIAFHAVKVEIPRDQIQRLLDTGANVDIPLFVYTGIMYFRPTGQSLAALEYGEGEDAEIAVGKAEQPPVAAILDGVPHLQHDALKDRLDFDDPDNLAEEYPPGDRRHGTAMASLVVHGELREGEDNSLVRRVFHLPVLQPNPQAKVFGKHEEHAPSNVFFEDRIERAVRRMLVGEGDVPAQAPDVKVINLSFGDPERPFIRTPSPLARLLDWLSWKYRVLFCVSAGNFADSIDVGMPHAQFAALPDNKKIAVILKAIDQQLSQRRLISPAESINALTVGALHADESGDDYVAGDRIDILPGNSLMSPISRTGHGFRRSIKPEVLFNGGRQLYRVPAQAGQSQLLISQSLIAPGQKVAWDSAQQGELSKTVHTRGTSNATALATRGSARIYEVLAQLQQAYGQQIREDLMSVLIKTLLVHGAKHHEDAKHHITTTLKNSDNSGRFRTVLTRYLGYGAVDIERVLACTEQRATVLGCGEIKENEVHEYRFPLPVGLSGQKVWRRMVVTLAWFSPINPNHRNLREAKLELASNEKWADSSLRLSREDSDWNQVMRGTVQHEILEGENQISAFQDGDHILLHVRCKKDATETLDEAVPYGLAVSLEVAEAIPIYQQIRARIQPQVAVGVNVDQL